MRGTRTAITNAIESLILHIDDLNTRPLSISTDEAQPINHQLPIENDFVSNIILKENHEIYNHLFGNVQNYRKL